MASIIFFIGAVIYFILGSGETQAWAIRSKDFHVTNTTSDLTASKHVNKVFEHESMPVSGENVVTRYDNSTSQVVLPSEHK